MARSAVPKLFWALPKSEFGEKASHNDPSLKHIMKKKVRQTNAPFTNDALKTRARDIK